MNPWLIGGSALALAVVVGLWQIQVGTIRSDHKAEVDRLSAQLKTANENQGVCHANIAALNFKLDEQGQDIRDLEAATKAAGDRATAAALNAAALSKAARDSSKAVLALPRPAPDMACLEAGRLLRDGP